MDFDFKVGGRQLFASNCQNLAWATFDNLYHPINYLKVGYTVLFLVFKCSNFSEAL